MAALPWIHHCDTGIPGKWNDRFSRTWASCVVNLQGNQFVFVSSGIWDDIVYFSLLSHWFLFVCLFVTSRCDSCLQTSFLTSTRMIIQMVGISNPVLGDCDIFFTGSELPQTARSRPSAGAPATWSSPDHARCFGWCQPDGRRRFRLLPVFAGMKGFVRREITRIPLETPKQSQQPMHWLLFFCFCFGMRILVSCSCDCWGLYHATAKSGIFCSI